MTLSTSITSIPCNGGAATGAIDLTVIGGTAPYTYNWGVGQPVTQDRTNLAVGTYNVTVTDAAGCTKTTSATITQPPALVLTSVATGSTCGSANGSINLTVSGGTSPYTFSWSNGATTEDISNVLAGSYTVTVTDFKGCTAVHTKVVPAPACSANCCCHQRQCHLCGWIRWSNRSHYHGWQYPQF